MRITAGTMRGRVIGVPNVEGLRPTPSKVRQALFNIIGCVDGFNVLDLYAGSGIMALEALSRGAESALSIEQDYRAVKAMKQTCERLNLTQSWRISATSDERGMANLTDASFDLIFADPPYAQGLAEAVPKLLTRHGINCGQLIIEESARVNPAWPSGWTCQQSRHYGDTCLHFLIRM